VVVGARGGGGGGVVGLGDRKKKNTKKKKTNIPISDHKKNTQKKPDLKRSRKAKDRNNNEIFTLHHPY